MSEETKPEMTEEELAEKWAIYCHGNEVAARDAILADLRSVIRGELIRFARWYIKNEGYPITDGEIEKFLNNNQ